MKRLFIGLPIQSQTTFHLAERWRNDPLLNLNHLAWTRPSNWHITLFFLGATSESDILILHQILDSAFHEIQSFNSRLSGVGVFPEKGRPRILWLGLENLQPLLPAFALMGEMLQKNGFPFDPKPLKPHLTLARVKSLTHPGSLQSLLTDYQSFDFGSVDFNRVTLFESLSTSSGVIYQPLYEKWLDSNNTN